MYGRIAKNKGDDSSEMLDVTQDVVNESDIGLSSFGQGWSIFRCV